MVRILKDGNTYTRRTGGKNQQGIRKNQSSLLSMEELFRYYLGNIIILRIGTGLRYLWLRFVRHRKISYRTLYEGSKSKKKQQNYLILKMKCQIGHGDVALFFL